MKNNNKIDIPLLFFSWAFIMVFIGLFSRISSQKNVPLLKTVQRTTSPISTFPSQGLNSVIDYSSPITCVYQGKTASIAASIENESFLASVRENNETKQYLLQGDCLYTWVVQKTSGIKKCGVGSYLPLARKLLGSGIGSINMITQMVPQSSSFSAMNIHAIFKTCKNVKEIKKEIFVIPKGIKFE